MIEPGKGQTKYDIREIYDDETGMLRQRQIFRDGMLHAPPNGSPSYAVYDKEGNPSQFDWHDQGLEHREGKPSTIFFHKGYDKPKTEVFMTHGEPRLEAEGYHIIHFDLAGNITETWTDTETRQRMQHYLGYHDNYPDPL